jgi:hypothetical protein
MVVGVWLYAADGRPLHYVAVALPMPRVVAYAGATFAWNAAARIYVEARPYAATDAEAHEGLGEARPEHYPR